MKHLTTNIINNYLDNDISYNDKIFVENHIQHCSECKNLLLSYSDIDTSLKSIPIYKTKSNLSDIIIDNIIKEKKKEKRSDAIVLSSIIGFIFLVLISLFIILKLSIQNSNVVTTNRQFNVLTNFDILWQFIKSLNFGISNDVILIGALISLLFIVYIINEIYQKIKVISSLKNEIR